MAFDAAIAEGLLPRRRMRRSDTAALVLAAVALALGAAAWISDSDQTTALASAALPRGPDPISFNERFSPLPMTGSAAPELKVRLARDTLARQLMSPDWRSGFVDQASLDQDSVGASRPGESRTDENRVDENRADESRSSASTGIPLPRARPVMADVDLRSGSVTAQADKAPGSDDRTLLQKLSDLLPGNVKLASLAPDGGLFRQGPDLAALGYDSLTAVYDISAHAVYLPSGLSLEAHSGMGSLKDDPEHVSVRMAGATPPAIYELKPREHLFHGVQALRMIPAEGTSTNGRSGLLTHSYMLGPDGNSNGCVSIRDYDRFLKAFNDGQFNRLVVVPSLSNATLASQHSNTPS